ncbi:MAG: ATP-binding domain-containing protein, partial [Acidimicrobiales bacterium]
VGEGNVAVITTAATLAATADELRAAGLAPGRADREGLGRRLTVIPVGMVKGLEFDSVVVVEPARLVAESAQGLRALYVALTRATRQLSVVHAEPLPSVLTATVAPAAATTP